MTLRAQPEISMNAQWNPQWQLMANQHRPTDGEDMQAECRRLRDSGLTAHDIATTLHLGVAAVEQALQVAA